MRFIARASVLSFLLLAGITLLGAHALAADAPEFVTTVTVTADAVTFHTDGRHAGVRMVVAGPEDWHRDTVFGSEATPVLAAVDGEGNRLPDGPYSVELLARPRLPARVRQQAQAAHERGEKRAVRRALRNAGLSLEPRTHHQSFRVVDGKFLDPDRPEPQPEPKTGEPPAATACRGCGLPAPVATLARLGIPARWTFDAALRGNTLLADQLFNENVEIHGRLCVGRNCAKGEQFGYEFILLKDTNLQIKLDDTSSVPGFPKNDWRIQANDIFHGGASYYSVQDDQTHRTVFRINAGAPANALFVDAKGDVGLGTANPARELHLVSGNTPTIRLEQTLAHGWSPHTWDIASNETQFFIKNIPHNSHARFPFHIHTDTPDSALVIDSDGVGLGTKDPQSPLHIKGSSPKILLDRTGTPKLDWDIRTDAKGFYVGNDDHKNALAIANNGNVGLGTNSPTRSLHIAAAEPEILLDRTGTPKLDWDIRTDADGFYVENDDHKSAPLVIYTHASDKMVSIGYYELTLAGQLVVNSGYGIMLGGTAAANSLDHYQTGTWTPTFTGSGGGTATYSANGRKGSYQRVGDWVTLQGRVKLTSLTGFSGTAQITGLPFAPQSAVGVTFSGTVGNLSGLSAALTGSPLLYIDRTGVIKVQQSNGTAQTNVTPGANLTLAFSVTYQIP